MPKPIIIEMGPFEGLHTAHSSRYIPPHQAAGSVGVDYTNGVVQPIYAAGNSISTLGAGTRWAHLLDGVGVTYADAKNFVCLDGAAVMASGSLTGIAYVTQNTSGGLSVPVMSAGANWWPAAMGRAVPTAPTSSVGAGSQRAYRITQYKKHTTAGFIMESNPSAVLTVNAIPNTLSWTAAGATGSDVGRGTRVYATLNGTTSGPYYLIYDGSASSTGVVDNGLACDTTVPLNWDAGGNPANTLYPFDHSQPQAMYVLADKLMGVPAVPAGSSNRTYSGTPRGGILFGAWYNRIFWSATGYPWYWPTLNAEDLDDIVEAIIVDQLTAYIITRSGVYAVTGTDDTSLDIRKTNAVHGCLPDGGPAACMTPYGVMYPGAEGIILFDGTTSRNLTADTLGTNYRTGATGYSGGYINGTYTLACTVQQGYILNLRDWPKVNVTDLPTTLATSVTGIMAMASFRSYASAGTYPTGLWLVDQANKLRQWDPTASTFSDRLPTALHVSGGVGSGSHSRRHRFIRFSSQIYDANVSFSFACYQGSTLVDSVTITGQSEGWLPSTFTGDVLFCYLSNTANTNAIHGFRVEAEVYD